MTAVRWDAVYFIVRGHDAHHARFFHRGFEGRQEDLAQDALRNIYRGNVRAAFGLAVSGEMLGSRHDVLAVHHRPGPLQRLDAGHAHARREIRVFAVSLFRPAPAWIARQIEVRAENLVTAANAGLQRGGCEDFGDQIGVPTRSQRDRRRKTRTALRHVSVQSLVVKHGRDAQPRVLFQPLLQRIRVNRRLARVLSFALTRDLPDAMFHHGGGRFRREIATVGKRPIVGFLLRLPDPEGSDLRDLLLDGHSAQQVGDPALYGEIRVAVIRRLLRAAASDYDDAGG